MRRKLARVGDRITYAARGGAVRTGTVVSRSVDYLIVELDNPRDLEDWEIMYPAYSDPMKDSVYLRSEYTIEEKNR